MDVDELVERAISKITGAKRSGALAMPRVEIASVGIDELLQGIGGDASGAAVSTGLRVPPLASPNRYLFCLASLTIGSEERVCIRGIRQLATIGIGLAPSGSNPSYLSELAITSPLWRFQDGNISWHLMRIPFRQRSKLKPSNADNFIYRNAFPGSAGALLYESATFPAGHVNPAGRPDFYVSMTAYTPPNGGQPYGTPLLPAIHDMRDPWSLPRSSDALRLFVDGPCHVALFASVLQTSGTWFATLPGSGSITPAMLIGQPEEAWMQMALARDGDSEGGNKPSYWRVAGMIDAEWMP